MKYNLGLVFLIVFLSGCTATPPFGSVPPPLVSHPSSHSEKYADYVLVEKSKNKMHLVKNNKILRSYNVGFGANPRGHKRQEGDMRTPEGNYTLTYKNFNSQFYKSIMIDYPNAQDIARAESRGVSAGGEIVIHGMPNEAGNYLGPITPKNWTRGCVAVRNNEMDEIFSLVRIPSPIQIRP